MTNIKSIPGNTKAGVLFKTTLIDYPGKIACAVFLPGCNLRCPYCYNTELVFNRLPDKDSVTFDDIVSHLKKRQNVLKGFVISGGEALLSPLVENLIEVSRSLGYSVKLDTNGIADEKLEKLINTPSLCPDFIALDIKTSPIRYSLMAPHITDEQTKQALTASLLHSVKLVSTLPSDKREFRTVLVPGLISEEDIRSIAAILPSDASWQFAPFRSENCIDPTYNNKTPFIEAEIQSLIALAKSLIPGSKLR